MESIIDATVVRPQSIGNDLDNVQGFRLEKVLSFGLGFISSIVKASENLWKNKGGANLLVKIKLLDLSFQINAGFSTN